MPTRARLAARSIAEAWARAGPPSSATVPTRHRSSLPRSVSSGPEERGRTTSATVEVLRLAALSAMSLIAFAIVACGVEADRPSGAPRVGAHWVPLGRPPWPRRRVIVVTKPSVREELVADAREDTSPRRGPRASSPRDHRRAEPGERCPEARRLWSSRRTTRDGRVARFASVNGSRNADLCRRGQSGRGALAHERVLHARGGRGGHGASACSVLRGAARRPRARPVASERRRGRGETCARRCAARRRG